MIVVVNGVPRAGKDLFCEFCCQIYGTDSRTISTVDFIKEIAYECGWDGTKTPKNRKFLSDLKDLLTEWNDVPLKKISYKIEEIERRRISKDPLIFIHCREPKEIQKLVDKFNAITVLVRRTSVENNIQSNHADSEVFDFNYDYAVVNDGTFEDLMESAQTFLEEAGIIAKN